MDLNKDPLNKAYLRFYLLVLITGCASAQPKDVTGKTPPQHAVVGVTMASELAPCKSYRGVGSIRNGEHKKVEGLRSKILHL